MNLSFIEYIRSNVYLGAAMFILHILFIQKTRTRKEIRLVENELTEIIGDKANLIIKLARNNITRQIVLFILYQIPVSNIILFLAGLVDRHKRTNNSRKRGNL